jgi:hypothetical protein
MISSVIFVIAFSLFAFQNTQGNAFAQGNETANANEMLSSQINGTGTVSPTETETKYQGFSEPQTPSVEQLKAFEEEINEEERVYPQQFERETEGASGLAESGLEESTATDVLVSPPELNGNITQESSNSSASSNTIMQNATLAAAFTLQKSTIVTPTQYRSTVTEPSVGNNGPIVFYTGNWFAARSNDYGSTWNYLNPLQGMPDFCCDQDVIYDKNYKIFIWFRQGIFRCKWRKSFYNKYIKRCSKLDVL